MIPLAVWACARPADPPRGDDDDDTDTTNHHTGPTTTPTRTVDGDVVVEEQVDVDALAGVVRVEGSLVLDGAAVTSLTAPDLAWIGGDLVVWRMDGFDHLDLPALEHVGGSVTLYALPSLGDLRGLGALTEVGGALSLNRLDDLRDVAGLESVRTVGGELYVFHTVALRDLDGLSGLEEVGADVQILEAYALRRVHLPALRSTTRIHVFECDVLTELALPSLTTLGSFELHECGGMPNLGDFPLVTDVPGAFEIQWDDAITDLTGFPALASAGSVRIGNLGEVRSLAGLSALALVPTRLQIRQLPHLTELDLPAARTVGSLEVLGNPALEHVGLPALDAVTVQARFQSNPALPGCEVQALLDRVTPPLATCVDNLADACGAGCPP